MNRFNIKNRKKVKEENNRKSYMMSKVVDYEIYPWCQGSVNWQNIL